MSSSIRLYPNTSRLGTVDNLSSGGKYDLLLTTFSEGFPVGEVTFTIEDNPKKITGLQKAVQVFTKILLTTKGTDLVNPDLGTVFNSMIFNPNMVSDNDDLLSQELARAIEDAEAQAKVILNGPKDPPDSGLASVKVLSINVVVDSIVIYMVITTLAGENAAISIPFPQGNR